MINKLNTKKAFSKTGIFWLVVSGSYLLIVMYFIVAGFIHPQPTSYTLDATSTSVSDKPFVYPPIDTADYDRRMLLLANNPPAKIASTSSSTKIITATSSTGTKPTLWPVKTAYPDPGAILPFKRIVAYYGNFYSKNMGILGQYPEDQVLAMLTAEVAKWNAADPETPVQPAIQYIAVTAQGQPGADGKYRLRMPFDQIDKAIDMAAKINAIVILDVQVGRSNVETEIPLLEKYLKMPQVHLAIDPEFSMKTNAAPGTIIGTLDATDINFAIDYLANLVKQDHLPTKILVIHRFTEAMLTNYKQIETLPEVQVVINMDGWGTAPRKISTYKQFIASEPVEFTGFKLFYKNDTLEASSSVMSPADLLKLVPRPIYVQYQ